ncbi:Stress protein, Gls24 family [Actinotalea ferrariae CF5-4]|uniref:Stress protein, Gls24 family n=1 Tax=Actinotalea ferrariae CF5-4 TaxID=948458 RepID=A0A021VMH6_9CELL|nr:Asp23/Gls24 family envelope stress response protein [Actinotalea ferrariae]EYR62389.1 Stress protein, Gls24 family [Actinotalea ferrariae CF5-4]
MSQTTGTTGKSTERTQAAREVSTTPTGGGLVTSQGKTSIGDGVVSKIAGIATREVDGVFAVGGGAARAMGAVRERIGGKNHAQGVSVEVGERQAAVDVDVVVEYGYAIADVADGVRRNVIRSIERMTGLEVTEVNVAVGDIHIPGEESEDQAPEQEPRVR